MNFLYMFCVVLCLHTSVSTPSENNARNVLYKRLTKTLNDSPTNTNYWQPHQVADGSPYIIQRITKDPLLNSIGITLESSIEKGSPVQNPPRTILTRTLLRDLKHEHTKNLQNEKLAIRSHYHARRPEGNVQSAYESGHLNQIKMYNMQNSPGPEPFGTSVSISRDNVNRNLLRDDIRNNNILPNTYKKREYFDSDMIGINDNNYQYQTSMKHLPLDPEETRLDLQGLSLEEVQSLTGTLKLGNPQERQLPSVINLNLDGDNILKSIPVHLINRARELHSIHAAAKKLKRYMIVHSDGTVEHTDNLEMVAKKYPNKYITIKSTDLEKYGQNSKAYFPASVSERQSGVSSSNAYFPAIPLTQEKTKQEVLSKTSENKDDYVIKSNAELALSAEKELPLPNNSSESVPKQDLTKNTTSYICNMPHENSVNKDLSIILKNSTNVRPNTEKSLKDEDKNKDHISPSWIPLNLTEAKIDKSQSIDSSTNSHPPAIPLIQENINQEVFPKPLRNKDEDVIHSNDLSAVSAIKELTLPNNSSETTSEQELTKKLTTHTLMSHENSVNENFSIVLKNCTTIGPNTEKNLKDIDKNKDNSLSWIPVNVTNDKTDNFNITSSSPGSPTPNLEDYSGVWFQDKDFWDNLKKGAQNVVYFFFVPPLPEVRKESKITLYPNGTKVEELTEIVENEGGIPKALKTTKVTHAAEDAKT